MWGGGAISVSFRFSLLNRASRLNLWGVGA
jgi:hypothetical protein